jgi:hypothetical protein
MYHVLDFFFQICHQCFFFGIDLSLRFLPNLEGLAGGSGAASDTGVATVSDVDLSNPLSSWDNRRKHQLRTFQLVRL